MGGIAPSGPHYLDAACQMRMSSMAASSLEMSAGSDVITGTLRRPRQYRNVTVDHVAGAGVPQQFTHPFGVGVVQRCFDQAGIAQHPGEDRLTSPVTPDLCEDGRREDDLDPMLRCDLHQGGELGITPFVRDQCTGVEHVLPVNRLLRHPEPARAQPSPQARSESVTPVSAASSLVTWRATAQRASSLAACTIQEETEETPAALAADSIKARSAGVMLTDIRSCGLLMSLSYVCGAEN